ncbi:MAG: uroporphyrinogen-III synthase, partial [Selenomonadaceae bacterium]|nr:uroporphyrinogen-III synthase [Selenomonadaceae bacterium]
VTGHEDPNKENSSINWACLATATDTLVFLMGIENLPKITKKLMENGRAGNTPAAFVRWGTRSEQETLVTTLENAAEDVAKNGLKPPAVFVLGNVVNLRNELRWFDNENRPLFGKRILVTRARAQASALTEKLEELGARVTEAPVIKIAEPSDNYQKLDNALSRINGYSWIIFTSVNGVRHFFARLQKAKLDSRALHNAKIAAIGTATAAELLVYGIVADLCPDEFRAEGIIDALNGKVNESDNILIPRAEVARETLADSLKDFGAKVEVAAAYKTVEDEQNGEKLREKLLSGEIDVVTFTSSSTVKNFVKLIGGAELLQNVKTACIGPVTAETLKNYGVTADVVAKEYTIPGLVEVLREL